MYILTKSYDITSLIYLTLIVRSNASKCTLTTYVSKSFKGINVAIPPFDFKNSSFPKDEIFLVAKDETYK